MAKTLETLKLGEKAKIIDIDDAILAPKLFEMGCLPGEFVELKSVAPMGCPIAIEVSGYLLSMRKSEAHHVIVALA
jgi:ferrous iron transport protein A